jgi:hypothetical protein
MVDRELKVVGREADVAKGSAIDYVEQVLFRNQAPLGSTIGTAAGRDGLTRADLLDFFRRHYSSSATTVVMTGANTAEAARGLLERAMLLPPALPEERVSSTPAAPAFPVTERIRATVTAAVTGYLVDPSDREICRSAAEVIELRLLRDLELRKPLLSAVTVGCITLRGTDLLVAFGFSPTSDSVDLPRTLDEAFKGAGATPPAEAERRILVSRDLRRRDRLADSPPETADLLADVAARPRAEGASTVERLAPLRFDAPALRAFAKRTFSPERRLLIFASPYEG